MILEDSLFLILFAARLLRPLIHGELSEILINSRLFRLAITFTLLRRDFNRLAQVGARLIHIKNIGRITSRLERWLGTAKLNFLFELNRTLIHCSVLISVVQYI
jgi:hypothetical protein